MALNSSWAPSPASTRLDCCYAVLSVHLPSRLLSPSRDSTTRSSHRPDSAPSSLVFGAHCTDNHQPLWDPFFFSVSIFVSFSFRLSFSSILFFVHSFLFVLLFSFNSCLLPIQNRSPRFCCHPEHVQWPSRLLAGSHARCR